MHPRLDLVGRSYLSASHPRAFLECAFDIIFSVIVILKRHQRRRYAVQRKIGVLLMPHSLEGLICEHQISLRCLVLAQNIERLSYIYSSDGKAVVVITLEKYLYSTLES